MERGTRWGRARGGLSGAAPMMVGLVLVGALGVVVGGCGGNASNRPSFEVSAASTTTPADGTSPGDSTAPGDGSTSTTLKRRATTTTSIGGRATTTSVLRGSGAASGAWQLRISIVVPTSALAGAGYDVLVKTDGDAGRIGTVTADYGDGAKDTQRLSSACSTPGTGTSSGTWKFHHTWRTSGVFQVNAVASITPCAGSGVVTPTGSATVNAAARASVAVSTAGGTVSIPVTTTPPSTSPSSVPASTTSSVAARPAGGNGPAAPTVTAIPGGVTASDSDGWIRSITIDWGDGSTPDTTAFELLSCRPMAGGYPSSSQSVRPTHTYTDGQATHHPTVTAVSTACDGTGQQTATGSFTYGA